MACGAVAAVLAAGLATTGYANAGEVPRGTTILGVEVGGRSRAEAMDLLRAGLNSRPELTSKPFTVRVGEQTAEIMPADVGLEIDVEASVAAATQNAPGTVRRLFGSREVPPVVTVDAERLDARLREVIGDAGQKMTMPGITFVGTTPKVAYPKPSIGLDAEQSAQAVRDGWLSGQPITIPLVESHPATTREELDRLVEELAKPAVSGPVTVNTDRGAFSIPATAIAKSLLFTTDKAGKITPKVDEKKLRAAISGQLAKVEVEPKDATITLAGGKPTVQPSTDGKQVDTAALSKDLLPVLGKTSGREVKGTLKDIKPKTTTEEISRLGIKEKVSTFTTYFTGGLSSPRSQNIVRAAQQVDGALVKPGEVFSLNKHTGDRNYAKGYKDAPTIQGGKLVPGVGGGVSQFTTTLFNATYYAGLEDVEHKPHSFYFSRYPAVIESTIFYPDLDFKFRNNTQYGVLIDTSYTANSITVSIWSTKVWDKVYTEWSPRRNITQPKTVYLEPGPDCIEASGSQGFTQDAWRIFRKDGKEVKREKFTWTYEPEPRFICGKKPGPPKP